MGVGEQALKAKQGSLGAADGPERVPQLLLKVGLGIALVLLGGLCWSTYDSYRESRLLSERLMRLQELRGVILHSEEVLSMSAAMAGATGDPHWEQRYRAGEPVLRDAIERARDLIVEMGDEVPAAVTDAAYISLGRMDARARELTSGTEQPDGVVFPGEAYGELRRVYMDGMKRIDGRLERASHDTLSRASSHGLRQVLVLLGLVPILIGAGVYLLQRLQKMRAQVVAYAQELAATAEDRDRFLSRMSHAIRSPMTSVLGYTDLLLDGDPSQEERSEYLMVIRRNGENVLTILGDLLDLAQLRAGNVSFELIEISPLDIMDDVSRFTRDQAAEHSLDLAIEYQGRMPQRITTDLERVRQVLVTLISNAIQFTESGGIRLEVRLLEPKNGECHLLEFKVTDTGIGMTPQQTEGVFDAYSRGGKAARGTAGTGLGLAISRELARRLGGDLSLESTLGQGTCVTFTIDVGTLKGVPMIESPQGYRLPKAPTAAAEPETITGLSGRLLVAEDTTDVRLFLDSVLSKAGFEVETAENGQIAYEKALAAWELGQPFDVVLMDMQMPVLSGFDATAKLREQGYRSPIIALTSHALEGDREACIKAGCDAYTTKPIDRQHLLSTIAQHLAKVDATA